MLEIHSYVSNSQVDGPYERFVIWVQGCTIRCPHCCNKHMWKPGYGYLISIETLYNLIKQSKNIEGITLLGGEPFDQAKTVSQLAFKIQSLGLGVVVFTGYTYEYLSEVHEPGYQALLEHTDLLIDGPFDPEYKTELLPWVGSSNQRYIHFSDRYKGYDFCAVQNGIEIHLDKRQNLLKINGLDNDMDGLVKHLKKKGIIM